MGIVIVFVCIVRILNSFTVFDLLVAYFFLSFGWRSGSTMCRARIGLQEVETLLSRQCSVALVLVSRFRAVGIYTVYIYCTVNYI